MTLPPTAGATSVCSSGAKLPVASKKRGKSRVMAFAVVTSTAADAVVVAFAFVAFDWAFEPPPQASAMRLNAASAKARDKVVNVLREIISFASSFSQNCAELHILHSLIASLG